MALLKWQRGNNDWVVLYGNIMQNRLRRDRNLSDLANSTEAKKNLGLFGDVTDHYHDARYMPLINSLRGDLQEEARQRKMELEHSKSIIDEHVRKSVRDVIDGYGKSISEEASYRKTEDNALKQMIEDEARARDNAIKGEEKQRENARQKLIDRINAASSSYTIGLSDVRAEIDKARKEASDLVSSESGSRAKAISEEAAERNKAIELKASVIRGWVDTEASNRNIAIAGAESRANNAVAAESRSRAGDVSSLRDRDNQLQADINQMKNTTAQTIDDRLSHYYVGWDAPKTAVNNRTIWFCIKDGAEAVYVRKNNRWVPFGSAYL